MEIDKNLAGRMWQRKMDLQSQIYEQIAEDFQTDIMTVIAHLQDFELHCEGDCCMDCKYGLRGSPIAGGYDG